MLVEEIVAKFTADTRQFTAGVATARAETAALGKSAASSAAAVAKTEGALLRAGTGASRAASGLRTAERSGAALAKSGSALGKSLAGIETRFVALGASSGSSFGRMRSAFGGISTLSREAGSGLLGMSEAGTAGFAAVAVAAAAFFKFGFDELRDQQRVQAQTTAAIKSTGGAANVTAAQVSDLAGSLQNLTGVDDNAVQSGENMLLTFTNIHNAVGENNDIFTQSTKVLLDMATAMNQGVRPSSEQLTKTAIQLGKALNDPVKGAGALRRVGVALTEQQQEQIKTLVAQNRLMDAQRIILHELTREFGGSAQAQAKTLGGQWHILVEQLQDLAAAAVKAAIPAIEALVGALRYLLPVLEFAIRNAKVILGVLLGWLALKSLPGLILNIASGLESLGAARAASGVLAMGGALEGLTKSLVGLPGILGALTSPLGLLGIGIAATVGVFFAATKGAKDFERRVNELTHSLLGDRRAFDIFHQGLVQTRKDLHQAEQAQAHWTQTQRDASVAFGHGQTLVTQTQAKLKRVTDEERQALDHARRATDAHLNAILLNDEAHRRWMGTIARATGFTLQEKEALASSVQGLKDMGGALSGADRHALDFAIHTGQVAEAQAIVDAALRRSTRALETHTQATAKAARAQRDQVRIVSAFAQATGSSFEDLAESAREAWRTTQTAMDQAKPSPSDLAAWDKFTQGVTDDFNKWHDSLASNLNFVESSLDKLAGTQHLTAGKILKEFDKQAKAMSDYAKNWATVAKRGGDDANNLLTAVANMGEGGASVLKALAGANKSQFNSIVGDWNTAKGKSNDLATIIQRDLVGSIRDLIDAIRGIPKWHDTKLTVDTGAAYAELNAFNQKAKGLGFSMQIDTSLHGGRRAQTGWAVPGYGGGDVVPAWLEPGEGVIRKEAVKAHGGPRFVDMLNAQHFEVGGVAGIERTAGQFNATRDYFDGLGLLSEAIAHLVAPAGGAGVATPGQARAWLESALRLTGRSTAPYIGAEEIIAKYESGFNPRASNPNPPYAKGLMQTISSTFNAYALPGHGDIWNPVDNAAASVRYQFSRYGDPNNVPGVVSIRAGGPYRPYHTGGVIPEPVVGIGSRSGSKYSFQEGESVSPSGEKTDWKRLEQHLEQAVRQGVERGIGQVRVMLDEYELQHAHLSASARRTGGRR